METVENSKKPYPAHLFGKKLSRYHCVKPVKEGRVFHSPLFAFSAAFVFHTVFHGIIHRFVENLGADLAHQLLDLIVKGGVGGDVSFHRFDRA